MKILLLLLTLPFLANAQNMDEKIKNLANEIADQIIKNGGKKVAVTTLDYKGCNTEFGKFLAEELTGNLSTSGRTLTVVNQKMLESLLAQNQLTAKGLLEARNDASKLGQVSGIDALVYGTITTLGEDIRISVSIIKLPTLAVFGYAKSVFPLTSGIKEMLPCLNSEPTSNTGRSSSDNTAKSNCQGQNAVGALFTLKECKLIGRTLTCNMAVSNNRDDRSDAAFNVNVKQTNIITDNGRQYVAASMVVGNAVGEGYWSQNYNLVYGTRINATININVEDSSIKLLQLFEIRDQGIKCLNVPVVSAIAGSKK